LNTVGLLSVSNCTTHWRYYIQDLLHNKQTFHRIKAQIPLGPVSPQLPRGLVGDVANFLVTSWRFPRNIYYGEVTGKLVPVEFELKHASNCYTYVTLICITDLEVDTPISIVPKMPRGQHEVRGHQAPVLPGPSELRLHTAADFVNCRCVSCGQSSGALQSVCITHCLTA